jgi:hypothetical protein
VLHVVLSTFLKTQPWSARQSNNNNNLEIYCYGARSGTCLLPALRPLAIEQGLALVKQQQQQQQQQEQQP